MADEMRDSEITMATTAANSLAATISHCAARHGPAFLQAVAEDVDGLVAAARLWGMVGDHPALRDMRAALRHANTAVTKGGRDLQTYLAYYHAMRRLHAHIGGQILYRSHRPQKLGGRTPDSVEYAEAISAKLDAAPKPPPPPPPASNRKTGTESNV